MLKWLAGSPVFANASSLTLIPYHCLWINWVNNNNYYCLFIGADISGFECPPPQQCSNNTLIITCKLSNIGLAWRIQKYSYETLFTAVDSAGSTDIDGPFTAVLIKSDPALYISTLSIEVDPSMDGIEVECIDGLNGFSKSCVLDVISK